MSPILGVLRAESVPNLTRRFQAWLSSDSRVRKTLKRADNALGSAPDNGKYRKARKILRRALVLQPQNPEIYVLLGEVSYEESTKGVISYFRKAIELDPQWQETRGSLGFALIRDTATRREGLDALEKAIELDPSDGLSHLSAGLGYWLSDEPDKAGYYYRKAVEICPTDKQALQYYEQCQRWVRNQRGDGYGVPPKIGGGV